MIGNESTEYFLEQLKIHCVKKHFKALNSDVEMQCAAKWDDFKSTI